MKMKILIACEFSGVVREEFNARGHDVWSCDLLAADVLGKHMQRDVLSVLGKWLGSNDRTPTLYPSCC